MNDISLNSGPSQDISQALEDLVPPVSVSRERGCAEPEKMIPSGDDIVVNRALKRLDDFIRQNPRPQ